MQRSKVDKVKMEKKKKLRHFRDLDVYRRSFDAAMSIFQMTKAFPQEEKFGLTSQMRRAASSIPTNMMEGSGRKSTKEFIHFLSISSGSCEEIKYQLLLSKDLGYIEKNTEVLGKLSKQIKKQYKKLDRLQRKAYWPEYYWLSYIGFLYHDIPHEVSNEELMSRSKAKLEQESFWQELNNKALPQEIVQNVTEYEALITQANKILDEHNL